MDILEPLWTILVAFVGGGTLVALIAWVRGRKMDRAAVNKTETETAGMDITNDAERLKQATTATAVIQDLLQTNAANATQITSLISLNKKQQDEFEKATRELYSANKLIEYQKEEKDGWIARHIQLLDVVSKAEERERACQHRLSDMEKQINDLTSRIAEFEKINANLAERTLREG